MRIWYSSQSAIRIYLSSKMSTKVWILRSFLIMQYVSALKIIAQDQQKSGITQEPEHAKRLHFAPTTESLVQDKRRSNSVQNMLIGAINRDLKSLKQPWFVSKGEEKALRDDIKDIAPEPNYRPQHTEQQQIDEAELVKMMSRNTGRLKSGLLGVPYIEKKGKNDYLVIQSESHDPFVTIIPNDIYYNVEKKCVNWLDVCSLRGIRTHLLEKVQFF